MVHEVLVRIVLFLFVHLFVKNVLLGDAQSPSGSPLVDFRCSASGFDSCLQAAIASSRRGNVGTIYGISQHSCTDEQPTTNRSWFSSCVRSDLIPLVGRAVFPVRTAGIVGTCRKSIDQKGARMNLGAVRLLTVRGVVVVVVFLRLGSCLYRWR